MRGRLLLLAVVVGLVAAPGAAAAPERTHGPYAGSPPPAPVFDPLRSFKIEVLPF